MKSSDWSITASIFHMEVLHWWRRRNLVVNFKDFFHRCRRRVVAFEAEKKAEFIEASLNIALVLYLTQFMIASEVGRKYISDRNIYMIQGRR